LFNRRLTSSLFQLFKFKGDLKQEIEVFMSNVFLRVLESENSSFKQKALVLESLRSLCGDPVLLTQLFLNYDCDFDSSNLYKDIVHMLTKVGGKATSSMLASLTASKKEAEQEFELSLAGLEVLVAILKACLKALGLPGGEDNQKDDTAGAKIRGMLQIDIGLAFSRPDKPIGTSSHGSAAADDLSASFRELKTDDAGGNVADKIVDAFEQKRTAEEKFETGSVKFTLDLKSGLNYFIEQGYIERNAKSIASFFLANKDKLDKTQMGEVLGREPDAAFVKGEKLDAEQGGPGFYLRILHHYVDALDFAGTEFDEAIRLFLSGFRLPGEAQKIDRIMEKFAQRYVEQNIDVFPSADTAFILAFSVIMLNTDLHNPSIKPEKRMTREGFIRNNRGIGDNGSDLPEEFLLGIYDRIKERPFSLKEDDAARDRVAPQKSMFEASVFFEGAALFGATSEDRKRDKFKKEKDEIIEVTQQLVRRRTSKKDKAKATSLFTETIPAAEVVKPIFHDTWGPMLGLLSQILECADDERSVALCLNAFVYAVRIAAHSDMTLARDTFVSSLGKFTYLGSMKDMKKKNVDSIRTLLSIAVIDGEYLGDSWACVLQCISQISRLRLSASGLRSDESFLVEPEKAKEAPAKSGRDYFRMPAAATPSKVEIMQATEDNNGSLVLEAVQEVLIDKVFSSTVNLTAHALIQFIAQLIVVSSAEVEGKSKIGITGVDSNVYDHAPAISARKAGTEGPSVFSLLKLVEVADYNMDTRPRLVWSQVWEMIAAHFAKVACHENVQIAAFSIDALKQLSSKFLEKPELAEFNFQRIFMNPFLVVMEDNASNPVIREMVLQVVDNTIRTRSRNLRSGWKVIFAIIKRAAIDRNEKIDYMGLSVLQRLLDEHLRELCSLSDGKDEPEESGELTSTEIRDRNSNVDDFVGLCRASLSFVHQEASDSARPIGITMRAFSHVAIYADLLADKQVRPPVSGAQVSSSMTCCLQFALVFAFLVDFLTVSLLSIIIEYGSLRIWIHLRGAIKRRGIRDGAVEAAF
jgi:brefeldin A-inhibited guanine nucleotide-exchange protein